MAIAHLLTGFVGSGKTTYARQLEADTSATRYSYDEWMVRHFGHNPPIEKFKEYFRQIEGMVWSAALDELRSSRDVIVDAGLWTRASRDAAVRRVESVDCTAILYSVVCPVDLMRRRTLARSEDLPPDSLWINGPAFEKFLKVFEPMESDEVFITVDGSGLASDETAP